MKNIHKNPILYYILVPGLAALWPVLLWTIHLPRARDYLELEMKQYTEGRKIMQEILELDPGRLERPGEKSTVETFDYTTAVNNIATLCRIPASNCKLSSRMPIVTAGRRSQNASVTLENIGIKRFAEFLSTIQIRWPNLQCLSVKLRQNKGSPDTWKIDLEFKYYF